MDKYAKRAVYWYNHYKNKVLSKDEVSTTSRLWRNYLTARGNLNSIIISNIIDIKQPHFDSEKDVLVRETLSLMSNIKDASAIDLIESIRIAMIEGWCTCYVDDKRIDYLSALLDNCCQSMAKCNQYEKIGYITYNRYNKAAYNIIMDLKKDPNLENKMIKSNTWTQFGANVRLVNDMYKGLNTWERELSAGVNAAINNYNRFQAKDMELSDYTNYPQYYVDTQRDYVIS